MIKRALEASMLIALAATLAGCQSTPYNGHGITFGCDGSGAGVVIQWGPSVRQGLREGGYKGVNSPYRWQTGAGVAVDHMSSPAYKRSAARGLANRISEHRAKHPDDPIYVGGLSAGCAVALYAIEQLPDSVNVDQVVLLSSSVSAGYDLSKVLRRVRGKVYAFTSSRDAVLSKLAATAGTADGRKVGTDISGLKGFRPPVGAGSATRALYAQKVQNVAWRPEFARYGHHGGHTNVTASRFVARYVAPLLKPATER